MKVTLFELCVTTLEAARAAESGGADRIELCSQLSIGGITPGLDLMTKTIETLSIPVFVLIRPRAGNFVFSPTEFGEMKRQIEQSKAAGAAGVAIGVLHPDGRVDVEKTRELLELARPMKVTFHRAFDETPDMAEALEDVIRCGVDCLLTSLVEVLRRSGVTHLHGSLSRPRAANGDRGPERNGQHPRSGPAQLEADVHEAVRLLHREFEARELQAKAAQ